jgi:hypothetical protein
VADLHEAAVEPEPAGPGRADAVGSCGEVGRSDLVQPAAPHRRGRLARAIGGRQRIARERVQQVGQQQLLMLLLVLQAELDERRRVRRRVAQQRRDARVDVGAPGTHLGERGPRHQPALGPRMARTDPFVVAVVEHTIGRMERREARLEALEHEGLEEPGHMREVPLGRARVGHRLHLGIGLRQRLGQREGGGAHRGEALGQRPVGRWLGSRPGSRVGQSPIGEIPVRAHVHRRSLPIGWWPGCSTMQACSASRGGSAVHPAARLRSMLRGLTPPPRPGEHPCA